MHRWGFLGASRIGERALAPAIRAIDGHALHAVAARDPTRARAYAASCGFPVAFDSYADLVASPDIDCLYIALTNDAHRDWSVRALEAGKHVLCEKPLVMSATEARDIADAERRSGRRAMEAFCHIHHPQFARARAAYAQEIGQPRAIHATFCAVLGSPEDYRWLARHGGGALLDLGVYIISFMRLLTGREPLRVAAVQSLRGDVDATFTGLLDFGDGLAGHFTCSFDAHFGQHFEAIGSTGRVRLDWPYSTKGRTTTLTLNGTPKRFPETDAYVEMVRHFGQAIDTGMPFLHPIAASVRQAMVLDALLEAARTQRTIDVNVG